MLRIFANIFRSTKKRASQHATTTTIDPEQNEDPADWLGRLNYQVDLISLVADAARLREHGLQIYAEALFKRVLEFDRTFVPALYELGVLYKTSNRPREALLTFTEAAVHTDDERTIRQIVSVSCYLGEFQQALNALDRLHYTPGMIRFMNVNLQFARYLKSFPWDATKRSLETTIAKHEYLDCDRLSDEIINAVENRYPFSFIRLGDGEGARVRINIEDEAAYSELYDENRLYFNHIWFGPRHDDSGGMFGDLSRELWQVVNEATVVGIPYQSWINHDFDCCSVTGIPSLTNIIRMLEELDIQGPSSVKYCAQNIHFEMAKSDLFDRIFASSARITLVSCYEGLPEALRLRFGRSLHSFFKVPGESKYRSIIKDAGDRRSHYPLVFEQIRRSIQNRDLAGHVFIIAAGYLGKFYCSDVRRSGGVAVDIGSIADGWMGRNTRPGMQNVTLKRSAKKKTWVKSGSLRLAVQLLSRYPLA